MPQFACKRIALAIEPLDLLVFRDGRPFLDSTRAESELPTPQTFAGAVRTWLLREHGCDFKQLGDDLTSGKTFAEAASSQRNESCQAIGRLSFRGPWFASLGADREAPEPLLPMPAVLMRVKGGSQGERARILRSGPLRDQPPGWRPSEEEMGMLPLWVRCSDTTEPLDGYVTLKGIGDFLRNGLAVPEDGDMVKQEDVLGYTDRTGIAVSPDALVAEDGKIYGLRYLALSRYACLYGEIIPPEGAPDDLVPDAAVIQFGGEGRRSSVRKVKPAVWPSLGAATRDGVLLLLITPGLFDGWRPAALHGKVVSAAVPRPIPVSGWDLARGGPKPNRFAAPAGSVYFLREPPSKSCDSLCEGEDASLGWGAFLKGVWSYV